LLGYEFPPDPPSCESPNIQKTIFKGKSSLTCLFSKTVSAGIVIDQIDLNLSDAFSRLKMAKDFGSSEGCVNDEEIFLRGKKNAVHEYKYFENAFLYCFGLQVLGLKKLPVWKQ
jgi:hypothetical protein